MNKPTIIILSVIVAIVLLVAFAGSFGFDFSKNSNLVTKNDPLNLTYTISGQDYALVNGKIEKEIAPGSASKEIVSVFGQPVYGDLNGDGVDDAVMYLTQDSGGSGTFFYVVEAINVNGTYKGTNAMFLGDRIAPQNINIQDGRAVANFAERRPGEDFSVQPSVGKSVWVNLDKTKFEIGELVKNFEGEADQNRMTLGMKTWQWISATYNDGTKITPTTDKFKMTFKNDGTFSATTDCNGVGGEYKVVGNKITFSKVMTTLMYCEGSQENDFTKILTETDSFLFTSKGELVFDLKMDSGSAIFK